MTSKLRQTGEIPFGPTKCVLARLTPGPTVKILQHLPLDRQLILVSSIANITIN